MPRNGTRARRMALGRAVLLSAVVVFAILSDLSAATAKASPSAPARGFLERLERSGRAEARFSRTSVDPLSGKPVTLRGDLALEPPDRVSLAFPASGERIVVREDGGEWLQPGLRQMMTLDRDRAEMARRWWAILLGDDSAVGLTRVGEGQWRVTLRGVPADEAQDALVTFDKAGLPVRLEVEEAGARSVYRLSGWRFLRPRGRAAFVMRAPAGFEVVALP
jgi:hypothetical protein